jgi:hypothetical protein
VAITHIAQKAVAPSDIGVGGSLSASGMTAAAAGDLVCMMVIWGKSTGGGYNAIPTEANQGLPSGFVELDREPTQFDFGDGAGGYSTIAYGYASGGETSWTISPTIPGIYSGVSMVVDVFRGFGGSASVRSNAHQKSAGATGTVPSVTPSAGEETALWAPFALVPNYDPSTITSGWTLGTSASGGARQTLNSAYRIIASPSGSYSASISTADGGTGWIAYHVAFDNATPPPPPPDPAPGVVIDPTADSPVPIGEDVISWHVQRGASPEITGSAQVGSATVVLKNSIAAGADSDNKYNPENGSSPLIAYLRDGTALHISVNSDGRLAGTDPIGVFGGRTQDWTVIPAPGQSISPTVEVTCEDALGWYGRTPVNFGFAQGRSQGALRAAILAAIGETRTELAHEIMTMPLSSAEGNALGLLEDINRANGSRHFIRPASSSADWYTYVTRNRQHNLDGVADYTLSQLSNHVTSMQGWRLSADTVINQQKATVTPIVFSPAQTIVWQPDAMPISVTTTRPFEVWVEFDDYVASPIVDSSYSGSTPTITLTAYGTTAKLTITVASGTCTFAHLTIQGSIARRAPAESWIADDLTSQALPRGVRSGSEISGEYVGTLSAARGIAEHVVWRYATPQTRPTITVENWLPYQYQVEIGDLIAYTSPQLGVTSVLFEVVGITHDGNLAAGTSGAPVVHHVSQFVLERCRVQSDPGWFVLNSSTLNSTKILAY